MIMLSYVQAAMFVAVLLLLVGLVAWLRMSNQVLRENLGSCVRMIRSIRCDQQARAAEVAGACEAWRALQADSAEATLQPEEERA